MDELTPFDYRDPAHRAALNAIAAEGAQAIGSTENVLKLLEERFGLIADMSIAFKGLALASEEDDPGRVEPVENEHPQDETVVDLREADGVDPEVLGQHDSVMAALAAHYETEGHKAHQLWIGDLPNGGSGMFDVWVPDFNRILDVETTDTLITIDPHRYDAWRSAGYEIWVVAPQDKLATVERRLGKYVDRVQPWSLNGPKVVFEELTTH